MTQDQALAEAQKMFPGEAVSVSRERFIGANQRNFFCIWKPTYERKQGAGDIMGSSHESWEGALIEARAESAHPAAPNVPFEDEVAHA